MINKKLISVFIILFIVSCGEEIIEVLNFPKKDGVGPVLLSTSPSSDEIISTSTTIFTAFFDQELTRGNGKIEIITIGESGEPLVSYDVSNNEEFVQISGSNVTIFLDLETKLIDNTIYYIKIEEGAILDEAGDEYEGFISTHSWRFITTANIPSDPTVPTVRTFIPPNQAGILRNADNRIINLAPIGGGLIIEFDEQVFPGTGELIIYNSNAMTEISVPLSDVIFDNRVIEIRGSIVNLEEGTTNGVLVPNGYVVNANGNEMFAITPSQWSFRVSDDEGPMLESSSPGSDEMNVSLSTDIELIFNKNVFSSGSGLFTLQTTNSGGNTIIQEQLFINDNSITVTFLNNRIIVDLMTSLNAGGKEYIFVIDGGGIEDEFGNSLGETTIRFYSL